MLVNSSPKHQYFRGFQRILFVSSGMQNEEQKPDSIQISRREYNRFLQLEKDNATLQEQLNQTRMHQVLMEQELANLKRMLFGSKSERHIGEDPSQLALNLGFDQTPVVEQQ